MTDQYALHARLLAGEEMQLSEASPVPGFWRKKHQGGWKPVAIWLAGETFKVHVDGQAFDDYARVVREWGLCCRYPVTSAAWAAVTQRGEPWPDEPPSIGHNLPEDPVERFKVLLEQEEEAVRAFLTEPVTDEEAAVKCGLWAKKVAGIAADIEAERKARKKPLDEQIAAIQATLAPLTNRANGLAGDLKRHMEAYLQEKRRRAQEEERRRQEAERAALAKAAEEVGVAPPAPAAQRSRTVTGGVTLRTKREVVFTDYAAAFAHACAQPSFAKQEAVQKIVKAMAEYRIITEKGEFPGAEIRTSEYAA